jgi:hypothetical protein
MITKAIVDQGYRGLHQRSVPLFELRIQGTMSDFTNRSPQPVP